MTSTQTVKNESYHKLIADDFEFRKMVKNHQKCEEQLENLAKQKFISEEDSVEMKKIQKQKLILKDQMEKRLSTVN